MQTEFALLLLILIINIGVLIILVLHKQKKTTPDLNPLLEIIDSRQRKLEEGIRAEIAKNREELSMGSKLLREEVLGSLKILNDTISGNMRDMANLQKNQLDLFSNNSTKLIRINEEKIDSARISVDNNLKTFSNSIITRMTEMANLQNNQIEAFSKKLLDLTHMNEQKFDSMRKTLEERLQFLQEENSKKLEQMRATVDEKLHETLEKRLGDSFKLVCDRLDQVHKGLGEMQTLANGVGDLKKVLSNVKIRGTLGEIQLGNLLDQILTPEQYAKNVTTKEGSRENVEYAIKMPGRNDVIVWLPIDAKFPMEDYQRLVDAQERVDIDQIDELSKALEARIKSEAKDIRDKYINPPNTTDFGVLFLPFEGLYAEVLRRPGLYEFVQRKYKVAITGPTTLAAFLNSLQMGFRTLAIEKRASEVWSLLGAVKSEFGKFGDLLDKTYKQIDTVRTSIENAARKSRTIEKKLKDVQALPSAETTKLLDIIEEDQGDGIAETADGIDKLGTAPIVESK